MLEGLGQTPDEVAAVLRARGIQGVPNAIRSLNPIVRYAQEVVGPVRSAHLINDVLFVTFSDGRQHQEDLPHAVREFLDNFNRGAYSDLHFDS